ncbi:MULTISPECIES: TrkH family potassium uptake protein [Brevibacterium]|uniref:TrkH family potassium uptake protein n=1 Tax=Brevibacterium TaxID=1696 RepID=UPI0015E09B1C|nr:MULTISPECIES: potassium transporter TrkG [Brevibacterium]
MTVHNPHRNAIDRVVITYLVALVIGTGLLMTPAATTAPGGISLLSSLFTSTSAISVTGLEVLSAGSDFTFFGQAVILGLIQAGGLGILLLTTLLAMLVAGKVGLRLRESVAAEAKSSHIGGIRPMVLRIIGLTVATELAITSALFLRFWLHYDQPAGAALWDAAFHAVSAFNNAGFGLNSDSLISYATDPFVWSPIAAGIILGGLGYPVLIELFRHYRTPLRWSMTTRAVIVVTPVLLIGGAAFIAAVEWNNPGTLGHLDWWGKLQTAAFQSTTARTAGFSSVDISQLHSATWFSMDILMFIGGGPAGTAGGVKITTVMVLLAMTWAEVTGGTRANLLGRRVAGSAHRQAVTVIVLALSLVALSTTLLMLEAPDLGLDRILFEVISAFANVGLTTGITSGLPGLSQVVLIAAMILGRLGPVTVASALALRARTIRYELPVERPLIG